MAFNYGSLVVDPSQALQAGLGAYSTISNIQMQKQQMEMQRQQQEQQMQMQQQKMEELKRNKELQEMYRSGNLSFDKLPLDAQENIMKVKKMYNENLDMEQKRQVRSVAIGALQLQNIDGVENKIKFLKERSSILESQGLDPRDTKEILSLYESGETEKADRLANKVVSMGEMIGVIDKSESKERKPIGVPHVNEDGELVVSIWNPNANNGNGAVEKQVVEGAYKKEALERQKLQSQVRKGEAEAAMKEQDVEAAKESKGEAIDLQKRLSDEIGNLLDDKNLDDALGLTGTVTRKIPGSSSYDIGSRIEKLKAFISADRIKMLRGLGAMSEKELETVSNSLGRLDPNMSPEAFRREAKLVKEIVDKAVSKSKQKTGGNISELSDDELMKQLGL